MDMTYLSEAFQDGLQIEDPDFGNITLQHHTLGDLVLTSGNVVACDPFVFPEAPPFVVQVFPGRYPVIVSVAVFAENNDQRVAYALLKLSEQMPVRWEMATCEGQDISKLKKNQIFCYPVDAGTGCFMDAEAGQRLQQGGDDETDFADRLMEAFDQTYAHTWSRANITIDAGTGANVIAFSSGWGDGCYASYWGYDEDNTIVCLVTDFGVLEHPLFAEDEEDNHDSSD